ncbi:glycogenin [Emericellopsis atlantica]|uniref:glycogenin glucosyltransferase n=1 Tax=Emericellopsis atlantica TaxID=2614577 RepID=A0A9P8CKU0_9HYPO|nr:glycogenin [Emericellopsis atlantica]KAG9250392.1 glycogenin [Emericellopsis atlantica]
MAGEPAAPRHAYATLLLNDSYLPGALVLAHSLRDARTRKPLVCLATLDSVSADAITQLKTVYDHVISVPRMRNPDPGNLYLMNRADLHSAFTKINLWKLVQWEKIVYIDADVVAYRAPDELFTLGASFAAAPDIGWPDLFNSGVMVLSPDLGEYHALSAMASRGISFDGADQGLLNMHFKNSWHRLSFAYNVTPSGHYQYVPAYRHLSSTINMVHFIGSNKPWFAGRGQEGGPYGEMVGRWWAVWDRHFREGPGDSLVHYYTNGEWRPQVKHEIAKGSTAAYAEPRDNHHEGTQQGTHHDHSHRQRESPQQRGGESHAQTQDTPQPASDSSGQQQQQEHHHHHHQQQPHEHEHEHPQSQQQEATSGYSSSEPPKEEQKPIPEPEPLPTASWDAQWHPPPSDSKPEAVNFPSTVYTMSRDPTPFVPPDRYPSPPKNMWYEVPKEPPAPTAQPPRQVFPWESHQPKPSRIFTNATPLPDLSTQTTAVESKETENASAPATPITPTIRVHQPPADSWGTFQLSNAWDEIPQINRYVDSLQQHRRGKSLASVSSPTGPSTPKQKKSRGFKLTDFPSEVERPSLPVTPAPIARPSFWGTEEQPKRTEGAHDAGDATALPMAEGVPRQSEWVCVHGRRWLPSDCICTLLPSLGLTNASTMKDPEAQLRKLAQQQYEHVLQKLATDEGGEEGGAKKQKKTIPNRSLPFGSEDVSSPTYKPQHPPKKEEKEEEEEREDRSTYRGKPVAGRAPTPGPALTLGLMDSPLPRGKS